MVKLLKLSNAEAMILNSLSITTSRPMFGLELVEDSGGLLKRGTVYVTLQRMEEKGLVESWREERVAPEIGIPRRLYRATGLGERSLKEYRARQHTPTPWVYPRPAVAPAAGGDDDT